MLTRAAGVNRVRMYNAKSLKGHWNHVSVHFLIDAVAFTLAFLVGIQLRFYSEASQLLTVPSQLYPSILVGALLFASVCYIFGFYSPQIFKQNLFRRSLLLLLALLLAMVGMLVVGYVNFSSRVGRGIMAYGSLLAYLGILAHHGFILRELANYRERVALVITSLSDEVEARLFENFWGSQLELVGILHLDEYQPQPGHHILGPASQLREIVQQHGLDRILCTNKSFSSPTLYKHFCELRYAGVTVVPLIELCEEVLQCVPLELMTYEWLMSASASPHMLYIKKIKRGFDIGVSLLGLLVSAPLLLLAMAAIRLTGSGPVFYHQVRAGRFGRQFRVIKLRTMRLDAEKNGAVWARSNDSRVTAVGGLLRKYRVDEIPQLLNVLRGDMSFVGPRPERPEFIAGLTREIPFFQERLMVQPGITGWAQVSYPYGASTEDARRKLEYDLYYMKHMSVFLDLFILLDTVRIVLRGGMETAPDRRLPRGDLVVEKHHGVPLPKPSPANQ
jgi:exopolysaccharide biosynthesis polyprenyl glycosylphosphotransferase